MIALEHPEWKCVVVDLDPEADVASQAEAMRAELDQAGGEAQIGYRGDRRYAARLVRLETVEESPLSLPEGPYALRFTGLGALGEWKPG